VPAVGTVVPGDLPRRDDRGGLGRWPYPQQGRSHRRRRRSGRRQARLGHLGPARRRSVVLGLSVLGPLANRGIKDVLIVCCDGLTGFPEAIAATWSQAAVQTCVVHLIRNALRFVSYGDRKAVAAALKPVYTAPSAEAARTELDAFTATELGKKNLTVAQGFRPGMGAVRSVLGVPARVAPPRPSPRPTASSRLGPRRDTASPHRRPSR
jgi:hypothetical protein